MLSHQVPSTLNSLPNFTPLTTQENTFPLERSKSKTYSESGHEEELENHEGSSTISGSVRVNAGINLSNTSEADSHSVKSEAFESPVDNENQISNSMLSKMNDAALPQEVNEYYSGCFFGDLEVEFSSTDQYLYDEEAEEVIEKQEEGFVGNFNYGNGYPYNSYKSNPYKSSAYSGKPNYQQKPYKGHWNNYDSDYYVTYQPKQENQANHKTNQSELYTSPNNNRDLNYIPSVNASKSVEKYAPKPSTTTNSKQTASTAPVSTQKTSHSAEKERQQSDKSEAKGSSGSQPSLPNDIKNVVDDSNVSPDTSKPLNRRQKKALKNQGKEEKSQDNGGFKLWDKINIKGKLKF